MKRLAAMVMMAAALGAQTHEVGLTLGRVAPQDRAIAGGGLRLDAGTAFQANYGVRLVDAPGMALLAELHFLANPQRVVGSANADVTRDVATLFVTPGIRLKFLPQSRVSPWVAVGGGYGQFEHSTTTLRGDPNPAPRKTHHGVFAFGGGVDVSLVRWVALRGEIRDFYSGNPSFNVRPTGSGQHNVVIGGGFVLRF